MKKAIWRSSGKGKGFIPYKVVRKNPARMNLLKSLWAGISDGKAKKLRKMV
jgi:hypothetical protein